MSVLSEQHARPGWNEPRSILRLVIALVICFAAAGLGSLLTTPNIPIWYAALAKPPFNPPNWLFAPVWTILFVLMAIGLWRVWNRGQGPTLRRAAITFAVQIVLNVLWSAAFFGLHQPLLGLVVIVLLILAIIATIASFATIDRFAAWLYAPYLAWVGFATILNASIWLLN